MRSHRVSPWLTLVAALCLTTAPGAVASTWPEIRELVASDSEANDQFGASVAVEGDLAAVGAPEELGGGAAYLFERDQDGADHWGQVIKLIADNGGRPAGNFGSSIAISGDLVVVGSPSEFVPLTPPFEFLGAAYVFGRDEGGPGNWGQVARLVASDGEEGDRFGISVSVSGDVVVVGADAEEEFGFGAGAAYVFARDEGGPGAWGEVKKVTSSDIEATDFFGRSVSVDGDTLVAGSFSAEDAGAGTGAAHVFGRDVGGADNWGEVTKLLASDAADLEFFGQSVAIDGDTVIIGAPSENSVGGGTGGAAYLFGRDVGGMNNWGEIEKITSSDIMIHDRFGEGVAISGDTAVVGAPDDGGEIGSAHVFQRNEGGPDNWGQVASLTDAGGVATDKFGESVAVSGDTAVVGSRLHDEAGSNSGAAYVFQGDADLDGVPDGEDNCPDVANAGQEDSVGNGFGDACDPTVPTLPEWGLILLALALGVGGVTVLRRGA
ncbi:MAG: IPTL-CTERM sorting domain-containing protein [Acidobacteriota bacterium]